MTRESVIESYLVDQVKASGGMAPKFKSPQRNNVPDRIVLKKGIGHAAKILEEQFPMRDLFHPGEAEQIAREMIAACITFVELKATGEKPTDGQLREHARLRKLGFDVQVIDSHDGVDQFMKRSVKT